MPEVGELRLEHRRGTRRHVLALEGELDMLTAPQLGSAARKARREGPGGLVVDLRRIVFMDSSGLRVLLATCDECRADGCDFAVVLGEGPSRRLMEITGALEELPVLQPGEL